MFCFVLVQGAPEAQDPDDYNFEDDYDTFYDYSQLKAEGDKIEAELDKLVAESDLKVQHEIAQFREENQESADHVDAKDPLDDIDEYQFEDNRDKLKDIPADSDGNFEADDDINAPVVDDKVDKNKDAQADYALLWGDDSVAPLPVPDAESVPEDTFILQETHKILENDTDNFDEEIKKAIVNAESFSDNKPDDEIINETKKILEEADELFINNDVVKTNEEILDETKKLLEEIDDSFNNDEDQLSNNKDLVQNEQKPVIIDDVPIEKVVNGVPVDIIVEESDQDKESNVKSNEISNNIEPENAAGEDTVDKVYADLNADLDKLLDTLDKLTDEGSDNDEKIEEVFDNLDDRLFKEDDNNVDKSEELVELDYENIDFEKIIDDLVNEDDRKLDDSADNLDLNVLLNDELNEPNPDDAFEKDVETLPDVNAEPILFLDAILDKKMNAKSIEAINENDNNSPEIDASVVAKDRKTEDNLADIDTWAEQASKFETVDINSLNSEELKGLVDQFSEAHSEVLDVHADTFDQNVAPIHIELSVDNPVVVTSPNYPSPYPTNNIIDWVFDGEGMGIEMNITDFLVNGALGDYLLVKPGKFLTVFSCVCHCYSSKKTFIFLLYPVLLESLNLTTYGHLLILF